MSTDQQLVPVAESPRWVRVWLGEIPIWIEAGVLERGVAQRASTLSAAFAAIPAAQLGGKMVAIRAMLPSFLRMLMDVTRWAIDLGWLDLPRPEPPRKGDPLPYVAQWFSSSFVDSLTAYEWQATYVETPDGGCQITGLAPRAISSSAEASGDGSEAAAGGDPDAALTHRGEHAADQDRPRSTLGDSGGERNGQDDVCEGVDPAVSAVSPLGADLRA